MKKYICNTLPADSDDDVLDIPQSEFSTHQDFEVNYQPSNPQIGNGVDEEPLDLPRQ